MSKSLPKRPSKSATKQTVSANHSSEVEEPMIAKAGTRMAAILYDGMLILALLFLVGTILTVIGTLLTMNTGTDSSQAQSLPTWYQNVIMTPSFILTLVGFYGIFWRRGGQTLGMQTWRLKTVNNNGHLLTWGQSFKRILAASIMPVVFGVIGSVVDGSRAVLLTSAFLGFVFNYAFCLFNPRGLAVQDMLSNTITLKMPKTENEGLWRVIRNRKQGK
ncbi:RDD family protein [Psychrobacter sp. SWN149]|uniref:RDD family protein n=1 Tax=Psychrobacter sp. SWN149 TaxID=2792057 RepID=UPI0018CEF23C|nr:RDD family protein [Psychrobacter sp. SWN149]MBH0005319.1 RDD family protein [Psychrobacter sp. SWN149]